MDGWGFHCYSPVPTLASTASASRTIQWFPDFIICFFILSHMKICAIYSYYELLYLIFMFSCLKLLEVCLCNVTSVMMELKAPTRLPFRVWLAMKDGFSFEVRLREALWRYLLIISTNTFSEAQRCENSESEEPSFTRCGCCGVDGGYLHWCSSWWPLNSESLWTHNSTVTKKEKQGT